MLDLRDGGKACLRTDLGFKITKTLHSLIDGINWEFARESARKAKKTEYVDTMRVWEAFAGVKLAQEEGGPLDKETSKKKRCSSATELYKGEKHFNLLKERLAEYKGDLNKLEHELEQCYIKGGTPNATFQQALIAYFAISEAKAKAKTGDYVSLQINSGTTSGAAPSSMSTTTTTTTSTARKSSSGGASSFMSPSSSSNSKKDENKENPLVFVLKHRKDLIVYLEAAESIVSSEFKPAFSNALKDLKDENVKKLEEPRAKEIKKLAEQAKKLAAALAVEKETLSM